MMSHGKVLSKWNEAKRLLDCWIVYICIGTLLPRELINWRSDGWSHKAVQADDDNGDDDDDDDDDGDDDGDDYDKSYSILVSTTLSDFTEQ